MSPLPSGVRLGLQQLRPGGIRVHRQPTHAAQGQQLPAEQSGGHHSLWATVLHGCVGQRRGNLTIWALIGKSTCNCMLSGVGASFMLR